MADGGRNKGKVATESGTIRACRILQGRRVADSAQVLFELVGDLLSRLIGRAIRRPLNLTPEQARAWGERICLGALFGAAVMLTLLYS